jgi:Fe-S-cluster-containing hydrogenase component 2
MRVRDDKPQILEHLCIDCTACIAACPAGALGVAGAAEVVPPADGAVLVIPREFLYQFGPGAGPERVLAALAHLGFNDVRTTGPWERALRAAVIAQAGAAGGAGPVISPACPAVVNLVQTRFPSLLGQLAPYLSPLEAMREDLAGRHVVFVVSCPAERSALESDAAKPETIIPSALRAAVAPLVAAGRHVEAIDGGPADAPLAGGAAGTLRATGLGHVLRVLEETENGLMGDVAVLDLWACDEGCFGSPLMGEDPLVAGHRATRRPEPADARARAVGRRAAAAARAGLRLDYDIDRKSVV